MMEKIFALHLARYREIIEKFFLSNIRLVTSTDKKLSKVYYLPSEDRVQYGFLGLIKAIEKWDYTLGFKFSTYAVNWIRQSIFRGIADHSRDVRIPVHMHEKLSRLRRLEAEYESRGAILSHETISIETETPLSLVNNLLSYKQIYVALEEGQVEESIIDTKYSCIHDKNPENVLMEFKLGLDIEKALNRLSPKQSDVIARRFGLFEMHPQTLEEIGNEYGVTRERIRQIEKKALVKLRAPSIRKHFDGQILADEYSPETTSGSIPN